MFVKIGMGIFDTNTIEAVHIEEDQITVHLKGVDEPYEVERETSNHPEIDALVAKMNGTSTT